MKHNITFYPRYSNPFCRNGRITIVNKNGSKVRTTVSLTNVYQGMAMFRFTSALGTSRILRRGTRDLPGIRVFASSRAMGISKGRRGMASVHVGSHLANRRHSFPLSNVFIRVNLTTGDTPFHGGLRAAPAKRVGVSTFYHAALPKMCTTKSMSGIPCGRVIVTVNRKTGTTLSTFSSHVHKIV